MDKIILKHGMLYTLNDNKVNNAINVIKIINIVIKNLKLKITFPSKYLL